MQDRSSYDITVHTSPTRRGNSLSPRPLYTASFSASQTALLSRRDSFRSMTSEIPLDRNGGLQGLNVNIVQTCDLDMDHSPRLATHIIGAAISPGLSYSPSHADSISTFASLQNSRQPLSTVDSINWHKHVSDARSIRPSLCSVQSVLLISFLLLPPVATRYPTKTNFF